MIRLTHWWMPNLALALICLSSGCSGGPVSPLRITTEGAQPVPLRKPTQLQLAAEGGRPPYSWTLNSGAMLPAGLSLSNEGILSGAALVAGSFIFGVTVQDDSGHTAVASIELVIAETLGAETCAGALALPLVGNAAAVPGTLVNAKDDGAGEACGLAGSNPDVYYEIDLGYPTELGVSVLSDSGAIAGLLEAGCPAGKSAQGCQRSFQRTVPAGKHVLAVTGTTAEDFTVQVSARPLDGARCDAATPLDLSSGGAFIAGTFEGATESLGGSCADGHYRVFSFVLAQPADIHVRDTGTTKTGKVLRSSSCLFGENLECVQKYSSELWATNVPAGSYYLFVTEDALSSPGTTRAFSLQMRQLAPTPPPITDSCASAPALTLLNDVVSISDSLIGARPSTESSTCSPRARDAFYRIDLQRPSNLVVSTRTTWAGLEVLSGSCGQLASQSCVSSFCSDACVENLAPGSHYLRVFERSDANGYALNYSFSVTRFDASPPANEDCATAEMLTLVGGSVMVSGVIQNARHDLEFSCAPGSTEGDVVYGIDLPVRSDVSVELVGAESLFTIAAWTGSCGGTEITCHFSVNGPTNRLSGVPAGKLWLAIQGTRASYPSSPCWNSAFTLQVTAVDSPP